ncbi:MAG: cytochrome P450 [Pseudotabrizicola sp.]|uniref:cytochrome P450 n=1 Tax=Pseudotabrizicola sp. TaxID=2939647 RepID=UPI0027311354|nr:cytochrome P450 [Pseudotabrizicola sp.]MDP2080364.1 cytochrome P450 [Pseudotabrizicola sp.]MDZ7573792.1 cytochrome P450 [Pseudotabrizicola sp.]
MTRAPGPKGGLFLGSLPAFKADPIGFLGQAVREHGPVVRLRFGPVTAHLLNAPDHIEHVLSRNAKNYDKATRSADRIAAATGQSLLSANSDMWARHRRLIQPAFQPRCFEAISGPAIDSLLLPAIERWRRQGQIDIVNEMMQLVIAAAIRILFSADIKPASISAPLEALLADTWRRIEAPFDLSMVSRHLHRRRFSSALKQIDAIVYGLIAHRKRQDDRPDDVLTRLIDAHEAEGETGLNNKELRDAAITLLLAGHETTANALAWAFIHAAKGHEDAEPRHIFAEALRLHPSIWVIERRAIGPDAIGGYHIPKGSSVLISPLLLHRNAALWPEPEHFEPQRWADAPTHQRHAYLPFGLGQHRCIGLYLAHAMAGHILATVLSKVRLQLLPGQYPAHSAGITLQHATAVQLSVSPRP